MCSRACPRIRIIGLRNYYLTAGSLTPAHKRLRPLTRPFVNVCSPCAYDKAIQTWIDNQLNGTSITVVLVGTNIHKSRWVKYEIEQSIARSNGLLTIAISKISDMQGSTTDCCSLRATGYKHYLWNKDNGRDNLGV